MTRISAVAVLIVCLALGCGSSGRGGREVSSPFTQAHAALFDDGVDLIGNPEALEGRWEEEWSREFDQRAEASDVVFAAKVRTIHVDVNIDRSESLRLMLGVQRTIKGALEASDLSLLAHENTAGYSTLERNKERLLDQTFIVFVKYAQEEEQVVAHFHLVPPSRAVLERVEALEQGRRPRNVTVITHSN